MYDSNHLPAVNDGRASYIPIFLSEISTLWKTGRLPLDVALLQVSPPDRHGFCSLGVSVDVSISAMQYAKNVVAIINPQMPRTHGEGIVHVSRLNRVVEMDIPLHEHLPEKNMEAEQIVGRNVARLVTNGATLQMVQAAFQHVVQLADFLLRFFVRALAAFQMQYWLPFTTTRSWEFTRKCSAMVKLK